MMSKVVLPEELRRLRENVPESEFNTLVDEYMERCYPHYVALEVRERDIVCRPEGEMF